MDPMGEEELDYEDEYYGKKKYFSDWDVGLTTNVTQSSMFVT